MNCHEWQRAILLPIFLIQTTCPSYTSIFCQQEVAVLNISFDLPYFSFSCRKIKVYSLLWKHLENSQLTAEISIVLNLHREYKGNLETRSPLSLQLGSDFRLLQIYNSNTTGDGTLWVLRGSQYHFQPKAKYINLGTRGRDIGLCWSII